MACKLLKTEEYKSFRGTIPLKKICVDDNIENEWHVYETGPKSNNSPLVCLSPISGNADIFYKQLLMFSASGCRVFSVEYAVHWSCHDFCIGLKKLLDHFNLGKIHLFGASLGGFLAQKFTEMFPSCVLSLILCNSFVDTCVFDNSKSASTYWLYPTVMLQRMISKNLKSDSPDAEIQNSLEFALESLRSLSQKQLASRLTLNCLESSVDAHLLSNVPITIINTLDQSAINSTVQRDLLDKYPESRVVTLESGGSFPYLSRTLEFNEAVLTHLQLLLPPTTSEEPIT